MITADEARALRSVREDADIAIRVYLKEAERLVRRAVELDLTSAVISLDKHTKLYTYIESKLSSHLRELGYSVTVNAKDRVICFSW